MVARACASVAAMLDVTEIVLGGVVPSVFGEPFFEALDRELDQRSGLGHLERMRVRGVSPGRIGRSSRRLPWQAPSTPERRSSPPATRSRCRARVMPEPATPSGPGVDPATAR
jgi:predicted NBD/HSP70 family sugar kinase